MPRRESDKRLLRRAMTTLEWTQGAAAERLGTSQPTISTKASGAVALTVLEREQLHRALAEHEAVALVAARSAVVCEEIEEMEVEDAVRHVGMCGVCLAHTLWQAGVRVRALAVAGPGDGDDA